jgi:hypothetical protein
VVAATNPAEATAKQPTQDGTRADSVGPCAEVRFEQELGATAFTCQTLCRNAPR